MTKSAEQLESPRHDPHDQVHKKILQYIDIGLDSFGENVRVVLYWKMERELGLMRENIPARPEIFVKSLQMMFGAGTRIVERTLIKEIKRSSGILNLPSDNLADAIVELKRQLYV